MFNRIIRINKLLDVHYLKTLYQLTKVDHNNEAYNNIFHPLQIEID